MRYVEAPHREILDDIPSVFLAGGITGCPDWQQTMVGLLRAIDVTLVNPRRKNFPIDDPDAARDQITWEHDMLRTVDAISFWFAAEEIQPIALYELGAWSMTEKPIFVGVHPKYKRRQDVEIQTELARQGEVKVVHNLIYLVDQVAYAAVNYL